MKASEKPISTLAWTRADYENAKEEIPDFLLEDDLHTEGELMSHDEIADWIVDSMKTFRVLGEEDDATFDKLYKEFEIDIHYLLELGKIEPEEAATILKKDNFKH